jgi:transposase
VAAVVVGVDPHKRSNTVVVIDAAEVELASARVANDRDGYRLMRAFVRRWADRTWAVEGAGGAGKHVAQRLVSDGETVLDVPAKQAARVRVYSTGNGRKNDPTDARSIAIAALRTPDLNHVGVDNITVALRLLSGRRAELSATRTQIVCRLHRLLTELVPGGAPRALSATKAKTLLATVRPRDIAGRTRRQLAADHLADLVAVDKRIKELDKRISESLADAPTTLTDLFGIGPVLAARIVGEVGDVARFQDRHAFASYTGTAPLEASSGDVVRHRLSRAGNRRLNHALHVMAITQISHGGPGRDFYRRKIAEGKGRLGAIRALKRRLSDTVYRRMIHDAQREALAGPGGHSGTSLTSSATGPTPTTGSSDKPLTGPTPQATPVAARTPEKVAS